METCNNCISKNECTRLKTIIDGQRASLYLALQGQLEDLVREYNSTIQWHQGELDNLRKQNNCILSEGNNKIH